MSRVAIAVLVLGAASAGLWSRDAVVTLRMALSS